MIGSLTNDDPRADARAGMTRFLDDVPEGRIIVAGHFDADGLAAVAILLRALQAGGRNAEAAIVGKGETPWDNSFADRLRAMSPVGLIVTDLGTRGNPVLPGVPTLTIDHHRPTGTPPDGVTLSGHELDPEPTSALIAWWAAAAIGDQSDLQWLAALGLIGDMAPEHAFPELAEAQQRWGKTALRDATSLVNAPRRTAAADASPALRLLLEADGPKVITKGDSADAAALVAAKAEVRAEVEAARRVPPRVNGEVALILFSSPCQVHPLIAQQWRGRLKDKVVIAANSGYRPGWVHFAARSASGCDLLAFLAEHRPDGADGRFGNGHAQATGGALPIEQWNAFVSGLGFDEATLPRAG
ncbi:single-stranded-DNA-specific exonuclease [Sphingomonas palmae]|uniref:Single-stranded-DNA-specific exonuclease n=1 Tax=Sphingomonas palmae TaxID=1855283 RepID=A0A1H7GLC4_9SPHN|nr:DHH family phosphoesterase [Sphingomonas palmae]SEK38908.1 single-stranded-DNA-specific exonuclease [Sphingomonas palmae]